jgi:tripartite-type tricarboxylate transporter receptor subunit TctC
MPPEIVSRLNAEVQRVMHLPEIRERLRPDGIETNALDAGAFERFVAAEIRRWTPVVHASGARRD